MAVAGQLDPAVAADLAKLANDLAHNPKTRKQFGKLVKEVAPDSTHAKAFYDVEAEDRFEAFRQEQADKEIKNAQAAALERMNQRRAALLTGGNDGSGPKYDEETVGKIEKFMQDRGITDYDDGAVLYASKNPPVSKPENEPPKHGATWEFPQWAEYSKDPVGASRNAAYKVIDEFAARKR